MTSNMVFLPYHPPTHPPARFFLCLSFFFTVHVSLLNSLNWCLQQENSHETQLWLTGSNIAIIAREKNHSLKLSTFLSIHVITSNFFDTRYAMHSVYTTAASTMNLALLNPFKHKQTITLTNKPKPKPRNQPPRGFLNCTTASWPHAGEISVFAYLWIAFYAFAVN